MNIDEQVANPFRPITDLELAILRARPWLPMRKTVHVVAVWHGQNPFGPAADFLHVTCIDRDHTDVWSGQWCYVEPNNRPPKVYCLGCVGPINAEPHR